MTGHRAKTAALVAYAEDLLSAEGRRRVEGHLASCAVCRAELAAIQLYDELVDDVREGPVPEIDFGKMELPLAREAERISKEILDRARLRRVLPITVVAAAAAAVLVFWALPKAPEAPVAVPAPTPTEQVEDPAPIEAVAALLTPTVTLSAGEANQIGGEERGLLPGDVLAEEARLRTGEDGELHVRLTDGRGIGLGPSTLASLTRTREDEIRLTLERGSLANEVALLRNGSTYVVLCSGYEVEVTGARFVVSYLEGVVGVDLSEGSVVVRDPDGNDIALESPARWRSSGAAEGDPSGATIRSVHAPRIEPTLATLDDLRIVRWEVDGLDISTLGALRLQLSPGEHEVRGWDARGRLFVTTLPVADTPVMLEGGAMRPATPHIRPGHLDPEDIHRVIGRGMRQVRRCYELSLRQGATIQGRARLRITVGVMGDVRQARVLGLDNPSLNQCIDNYASRWTFPTPGGPVSLEQPLNLTPTQ